MNTPVRTRPLSAQLVLTVLLLAPGCFHKAAQYDPLDPNAAGGAGGGSSDAQRGGPGGAGGASADTGSGTAMGGAGAGLTGPRAAEPDVDAAPVATGCTAGTRTCLGEALSVCEPGGLATTTPCPSGCDATRGACYACRPNSRTCSDGKLVVCNAAGTGTDQMMCGSGCNSAGDDCRTCVPAMVWCSGNTLRQCTPAGEPMDRETCAQGCNGTRLACNVCPPGQVRCGTNVLQTCSADGARWNDSPCPLGCDPAKLACTTCVAQTEVCDGRDNDCDGDTDENLTESCSSACGSGMRRCLDGRWDDSACPRQPKLDDPMACGAPGGGSCERCEGVANGSGQCRSGVCALACNGGFLRCGGVPGSCVRSAYGFESGGAEGFKLAGGFQSDAADGFMVGTARAAEGSRALTIPVTYGANTCDRRNIRLDMNLCDFQQGADVSGKTLTMQVFLEGPALFGGGDKQLTIGDFSGGSTDTPVAVNRWLTLQHRFGDDATSGIYFNFYMLVADPPPASACRTWKGTIYLDNIRIQ